MKIAIVGAGISGLYLAQKLAKKGNDVTVFEKKTEIGNSACSGFFSERILDHIPESKLLIQNTVSYALIHFPKKTVRLDFSKKFFVMSHFQLDKLSAELAERAGAKVILNTNIRAIPESYDRVIGCDGPLSFVRKNLGLKDPKFKLGILGFAEAKPLQSPPSYSGLASAAVETWPLRQGGFIWKISRGANVEYGIMADVENAKTIFNKFLKEKNIVLTGIRSKLIPQGLIFPKNANITLAGDASGLTKPWSGGGVLWQMKQADILVENFPDFGKYVKEVKREFKPKLRLGRLAVALAYFLGFNLPWLLPAKNKIESDFLIKKKGRSSGQGE